MPSGALLRDHHRTKQLYMTLLKRKTTTKSVFIVVVMAVIISFRPLPEKRFRPGSNDHSSAQPGSKPAAIPIKAYHPYCLRFVSPPPDLAWEEVYWLEWNGTPAISEEIDATRHTFQTTQFTTHVKQLVRLVDLEEMELDCIWKFSLSVDKHSTLPVDLSCQGKARQRMVSWWCTVLERLFLHDNQTMSSPNPRSANLISSRGEALNPVLPGSVTLAVSSNDYYEGPAKKRRKEQSNTDVAPYTCLANSSPNGTYAITNFLELQRMTDNTAYAILPWHERCATPIWRGSAWVASKSGTEYESGYGYTYPALHKVLRDCLRCRAVEFSNRHADLLDAKFGDPKNGLFHPAVPQFVELWRQNTTNGLDTLLPIHYIPPAEYYSHFQVALVLCGLGAAFRTPIHLSTSTAVVMQDCANHEWYHPWFKAWEHYVPLQHDLSDLKSILTWIRNHPSEVHKIALQGRQFYVKYLSFQRNYEHFYELAFRMALKKLDQERLQH
jgi:hypothetical protein